MDLVLFPGRHHLLTRFQAHYLHALLAGLCHDRDGAPLLLAPDARVVFAVTSANHANARRNPLPAHRREAAIERFAADEGLAAVVVPVVDTRPTPRFAEVVVTSVAVATADAVRPDPATTVVACSTPEVAALYAELGYRVATVEAAVDPPPARPWEVVELLAAGDERWRGLAHPASQAVLDRYGWVERIRRLFADPVVSAEGALTATRAYRAYAAAFEDAADRKWAEVAAFVQPGRIVDLGCATGGLLERAAADPRLRESDLFGVEVDRHLLAECEHKRAQGVFANPNTFFLQRNLLREAAFPPASIDTTLTLALTHEVVSYGEGTADLERFAARVAEHTAPGGVWVNADVCGPDAGDRPVLLELAADDGEDLAVPATDLDDRDGAAVAAFVGGLCTRARLVQFAHDFPRLARCAFAAEETAPGVYAMSLRDAMEFLTRKDYAENWLSECHERFCTLDGPAWWALAEHAGLDVDPASRTWRNDWLVAHRLAPVARLRDPTTGEPLEWPATHVLLVARRPLS